LKPAVKTKPTPRGGRAWPKQPINKTIGINKLGTLLSSQTTDTPGTTTTKHSAMDRSGATFQPYPVPRPDANPSSRTHTSRKHNPTKQRRSKEQPYMVSKLGVWPPAVTSSSLFPSRRLRKQYTHPTPTANPPHTTPKPRKSGPNAGIGTQNQAPPSHPVSVSCITQTPTSPINGGALQQRKP
jgi:hypothetical protein